MSSPSAQLRKHEELAQIRAALRQLPVEQQVLLELHYWHDLDAPALAEVFGITSGAIRVRLLRARRALRDRLGTAIASGAFEDPLTGSLHEAELDGELEA